MKKISSLLVCFILITLVSLIAIPLMWYVVHLTQQHSSRMQYLARTAITLEFESAAASSIKSSSYKSAKSAAHLCERLINYCRYLRGRALAQRLQDDFERTEGPIDTPLQLEKFLQEMRHRGVIPPAGYKDTSEGFWGPLLEK